MPTRRHVLAAALTLPAMARPAIVRAASTRVLKFIPQADVSVIDPVWSTAYNSRNHRYLVFDTLFGMDSHYKIQPQMLAGYNVAEDGKQWDLTLRDRLLFHDGSKVLARDCVASIRRWVGRG